MRSTSNTTHRTNRDKRLRRRSPHPFSGGRRRGLPSDETYSKRRSRCVVWTQRSSLGGPELLLRRHRKNQTFWASLDRPSVPGPEFFGEKSLAQRGFDQTRKYSSERTRTQLGLKS